MKNSREVKIVEDQVADKLPAEIKLEFDGQNLNKNVAYEDIEKDLNARILKVTMKIKDHYPELSKYLDEMPVTVPSEKDPEITLNNLKTYYESLNSLLNKYKVDFPKIEE
jgi:hypothetical protein